MKPMTIRLEPDVALILETITVQTRGQEFSGFAYARWDLPERQLLVYDFVLLDVGSTAYTEIPAKTMYDLSQREDAENMRVWLHKHPIGDGKPGWQNWSGTDNNTIHTTPLGSVPQIVQWSASIVRTPRGWVGRIDNHIKGSTIHVDVLPKVSPEVFDKVEQLYNSYLNRARQNNSRSIVFGNRLQEEDLMYLEEGDELWGDMWGQASFLTDEDKAGKEEDDENGSWFERNVLRRLYSLRRN